MQILERLYELIAKRRDERPEGSYVVSLFAGGWDLMAAKVREESEEVVQAARVENDEALTHEIADLIFHIWVLMASRGIEPRAIYSELERRFGIGGLKEKASRLVQDEASRP
jgi:phosphoribosyl-ATP pyrophosphohydrolase